MAHDFIRISGDRLTGRGLSVEVFPLLTEQVDITEQRKALIEVAELIYAQGRGSVLPSLEDRYDLQFAVEALRALATILGSSTAGERNYRAACVLAKLLEEQGEP